MGLIKLEQRHKAVRDRDRDQELVELGEQRIKEAMEVKKILGWRGIDIVEDEEVMSEDEVHFSSNTSCDILSDIDRDAKKTIEDALLEAHAPTGTPCPYQHQENEISSLTQVFLSQLKAVDDDDLAAISESEEIARAIADSTTVDDGLISIDPITDPLNVAVDDHTNLDEINQDFEEDDLGSEEPLLDIASMAKALEDIF